MTVFSFSFEEIGPDQLHVDEDALSDTELATLWDVLPAIEMAWQLEQVAFQLKSQWKDLIAARSREPNSYFAEFKNAAAVLAELSSLGPAEFADLVFFRTIVRQPSQVVTRLDHAKFFVINDFIRFLILSGGFKQFGARNYSGFMGGSRFTDTPPVRTGTRL